MVVKLDRTGCRAASATERCKPALSRLTSTNITKKQSQRRELQKFYSHCDRITLHHKSNRRRRNRILEISNAKIYSVFAIESGDPLSIFTRRIKTFIPKCTFYLWTRIIDSQVAPQWLMLITELLLINTNQSMKASIGRIYNKANFISNYIKEVSY